jgi:NAD(P)-dependent dehydrogenase (short-subunit alcohol dehydrogenase family)
MDHLTQRHAGRTAVITGGAAGIGQSTRRVYQRGRQHRGRRPRRRHRDLELVAEIGAQAMAITCDVADPVATSTLADQVKDFGHVDILVNNAGIYPFTAFDEMTWEQWHRVLSVNLDSLFLVTKQFVLGMREGQLGPRDQHGVGDVPRRVRRRPHYVASKGGVIGLTRALAGEPGPNNITINAIAPSLVRSVGTSTGFHDEVGMFDAIISMQALARTQMPDDLSGVVSFLASTTRGSSPDRPRCRRRTRPLLSSRRDRRRPHEHHEGDDHPPARATRGARTGRGADARARAWAGPVKVGAVSVNSYLDVTNRQGGINYRTYPMPNILGSEHAGQLVAPDRARSRPWPSARRWPW